MVTQVHFGVLEVGTSDSCIQIFWHMIAYSWNKFVLDLALGDDSTHVWCREREVQNRIAVLSQLKFLTFDCRHTFE